MKGSDLLRQIEPRLPVDVKPGKAGVRSTGGLRGSILAGRWHALGGRRLLADEACPKSRHLCHRVADDWEIDAHCRRDERRTGLSHLQDSRDQLGLHGRKVP